MQLKDSNYYCNWVPFCWLCKKMDTSCYASWSNHCSSCHPWCMSGSYFRDYTLRICLRFLSSWAILCSVLLLFVFLIQCKFSFAFHLPCFARAQFFNPQPWNHLLIECSSKASGETCLENKNWLQNIFHKKTSKMHNANCTYVHGTHCIMLSIHAY